MKAFVGVSDKDRFNFLASKAGIDEVNFWQTGGGHLFRALNPGEPFLFKLHSSNNFIVGGGFFAHSTLLPASLACDAFEEKNGAVSFDGIQNAAALFPYRGQGILLRPVFHGLVLEKEIEGRGGHIKDIKKD